jgi:hypothetical protein
MWEDMCVSVENGSNSKLLALLGTLEERDKDIVMRMSESLVEKYNHNLEKISNNISTDKMKGNL